MARFRIDLHVHTSRHSPCAELLDPRSLAAHLRRSALHGVVLTEHDVMWRRDELAEITSDLDAERRIYRGVEVSSSDAHFVLVGLDGLGDIRRGIGAAALVKIAEQQHAVVILAHPLRRLPGGATPVLERLPDGIHAVEVPRDGSATTVRALARERGWVLVGASDAHSLEAVGDSFTELPFLPATERELAQALKDGKGRAGHRRGAIRVR